jgi:aspartyl-tRNA(Asn)/glutamyl-tRNA(Gln) amidotransferase subunit A
MWRFMADYDLLLTPTLAVPPFPLYTQGPEVIDERMLPSTAWLGFCFPINLTGQPAASVPAGFMADGLPVGLQIVGRHLGGVRGRRPVGRALAGAAPDDPVNASGHIGCVRRNQGHIGPPTAAGR